MPKIIENLETRLIAEAQKQIIESGYNAMTIRSVAKACDVGVGTVYNYFLSKDQLLAALLLQDWKEYLAGIHAVSQDAQAPRPVLQCIHDQLRRFIHSYDYIFRDADALAAVAASFSRFHSLLRSQLAQEIRDFFSSDFEAEFIIEALLSWTSEGKEFDEIYSMIRRLI